MWMVACSASRRRLGGQIVNRDRMWHYTEGIQNWNPIWPNHGIRILPGPSSLWLDAAWKSATGAAVSWLRYPGDFEADPENRI